MIIKFTRKLTGFSNTITCTKFWINHVFLKKVEFFFLNYYFIFFIILMGLY